MTIAQLMQRNWPLRFPATRTAVKTQESTTNAVTYQTVAGCFTSQMII
uniref:Uncharacterized protein n=1 Tax=Anguilla anguilla TaxID=7936 RepID=A0A0E9U057_ANGAN